MKQTRQRTHHTTGVTDENRDERRGFAFAVTIHVLMVVLMLLGFQAAPHNPNPVQIELWAQGTAPEAAPPETADADADAAKPTPNKYPAAEPKPEPDAKPQPTPTPQPAPAPQPKPTPTPPETAPAPDATPQADPDIALDKERKKKEEQQKEIGRASGRERVCQYV